MCEGNKQNYSKNDFKNDHKKKNSKIMKNKKKRNKYQFAQNLHLIEQKKNIILVNKSTPLEKVEKERGREKEKEGEGEARLVMD